MFRIYRNTIIAAGLILIIASPTLGQQGMPEGIESENGGQQASENHKPESAPKDQVAVPVKTEKTDLGPDNSTGDSQSAEYQEVLESYWSWNGFITPSDTLAQWLMALFGIVATGVSIWAVILLKCTLDESKCATNAAVHAAKAADETIKVTREAHQNERRPWILVEPEIVGNLVISDGKIDFSTKPLPADAGRFPF